VDRWFAWERGARPGLSERLQAVGVAARLQVGDDSVLVAGRHLQAVARW
jgi:hypothetical protein